MVWIGSPGRIRTRMKVSTMTPSSTGNSCTRRRATNRSRRIGGDGPSLLADPQVTQPGQPVDRLHPAGPPLTDWQVEVGLADDHPRHVLGQDLLHPQPHLHPLLLIHHGVGALVDLLDLRVAVA